VTRRPADARRTDESGSALVLALLFVAVFGLIVGVVLNYASAGLRTTTAARETTAKTVSADGAIDGAINALSKNLLLPGSVDPSPAPLAAVTCFSLSVGQLDYPDPITVTCTPLAGSGMAIVTGDPIADAAASPAPRVVVVQALDATTNVPLLRAEVRFADPANPAANGATPTVVFWSPQ
jgi:hypothetical protein